MNVSTKLELRAVITGQRVKIASLKNALEDAKEQLRLVQLDNEQYKDKARKNYVRLRRIRDLMSIAGAEHVSQKAKDIFYGMTCGR